MSNIALDTRQLPFISWFKKRKLYFFPVNPSGPTDERITEDGSVRLTQDGQIRIIEGT